MDYPFFQVLCVPKDGDLALLVYSAEDANARLCTSVKHYRSYGPNEDPFAVLGAILHRAGLERSRVGFEGAHLTANQYRALTDQLGTPTWADGSGIVEHLRAIKSAAELKYMRQAAEALRMGMRSAIDAIRPGVSDREIAAAIYRASVLAGSEHMAATPFVAAGPRSAWPHATWSGYTLEAGDPVFLELSARVKGYTVAFCRTACLSPVSDVVRELDEVVQRALQATLKCLKPGAISADVDRACREVITDAGCGEFFRHRTGYSIGLTWGEAHIMAIQPGDRRQLQAGMVFHLVPHIEMPDRGISVGSGDTVLITDEGHEALTQFDRAIMRR
jgi:Xaa-Pro dipeptidase